MTTTTLTADPAGLRASVRSTTSVLRPMTLSCDASSARVALVPETALLLADDHVSLDITVGPGAHLELVETSGTVAYDMRGASASWDVSIAVGDGGCLVWHGLPFVVAAGADVERNTTITLAPDARLLLRETLVLGRIGEAPGRLRSRLDAGLLVEDLDASVLPCRVLDTVLAVGHAAAPGAMELESGDHLYRALTDEAHLSPLTRTWQGLARRGWRGQSLTDE